MLKTVVIDRVLDTAPFSNQVTKLAELNTGFGFLRQTKHSCFRESTVV